MKRILCFLLGHDWVKYKRWDRRAHALDRQLRQWRRCLRCTKREVV